MNLFSKTTRIVVTLLAIAGLAVSSAFAEICLMPCGQEAPQQAVSCCDSKPAPGPAAKAHKRCGMGQPAPDQVPAVSSRNGMNSEMCACEHQAPVAVVSAAMPLPGHSVHAPVSAVLSIWQRAMHSGGSARPTICDTSPAGSPPAFMEHCSYLC